MSILTKRIARVQRPSFLPASQVSHHSHHSEVPSHQITPHPAGAALGPVHLGYAADGAPIGMADAAGYGALVKAGRR